MAKLRMTAISYKIDNVRATDHTLRHNKATKIKRLENDGATILATRDYVEGIPGRYIIEKELD